MSGEMIATVIEFLEEAHPAIQLTAYGLAVANYFTARHGRSLRFGGKFDQGTKWFDWHFRIGIALVSLFGCGAAMGFSYAALSFHFHVFHSYHAYLGWSIITLLLVSGYLGIRMRQRKAGPASRKAHVRINVCALFLLLLQAYLGYRLENP